MKLLDYAELDPKIASMRLAGMCIADIASELGISATATATRIRLLNIIPTVVHRKSSGGRNPGVPGVPMSSALNPDQCQEMRRALALITTYWKYAEKPSITQIIQDIREYHGGKTKKLSIKTANKKILNLILPQGFPNIKFIRFIYGLCIGGKESMNKFAPFYEPPKQPKPVLMQTISETELLRLRAIEEAADSVINAKNGLVLRSGIKPLLIAIEDLVLAKAETP
jgi:hypothetical protein